MAQQAKTQVVIVGAGPTGLSLAVQLIRYGIDFIIIERNSKTTHLSKAVVVQARTLEIFTEIGLAQKAISRGRTTMAFNMYYNGKHRAHLDLNGLGTGQSAFPFALSLEQSKTEQLLAEYLSEHGKEIRWNTEFMHFDQDENGAVVFCKDPEGHEVRIAADYVVGCDGAGSLIRHKAGMSFEGDTVPKIFYVADVTLESPIINKNELFVFLIPKGFVLFFPMEGTGHYRVIGILPEMTAEEAEDITFDDIKGPIVTQLAIPLRFSETRWFSHYKVHSRKADTFRSGRCFIAGDAAHIHTPAGGQGMNTGIQDTYNLAWKMALVLRSEADAGILETYNTERMENAKRLLNTTDQMFEFIAGTTWFSNFMRLHIFPLIFGFLSKNPKLNKFVFPLISQTGIAYRSSGLTAEGKIGKVSAGDRIHYFKFSNGKDIFEYLTDSCFKAIYFGPNSGDFTPLKKFQTQIRTMSFTEIPRSVFGNSSGFYILVRPDNHISYIGSDLAEGASALSKFLTITNNTN